jgi:hypothetical protein
MNFQEITSGPVGELRIYKTYLDGKKEIVFEGKNLIVTTGKSILLNQLYYTSVSGNPLSHAKIGRGGAIDPGGVFPQVPTRDMTDLYDPITSVPILKTDEDITIPSITLMANVDNGVANGEYINEAGFFAVSGDMFNIKTFPRILKKSSFSLNLEWVIKML